MGRAGSLLKQNLMEEAAMAKWIDEHLVPLTMKYASLCEAGEVAKR